MISNQGDVAQSASYTKVNYGLRPAKQTERRMFCEALRKLWPFRPVESYRYIGFGSVYFVDFCLFHRQLGICDMINLEVESDDEERFRFNRPFACVDLQFGPSGTLLDHIDWAPETILWLDYDHRLTNTDLDDVYLFCANACSGSVLIVTTDVDVTFEKSGEGETESEERNPGLEDLIRRLGEIRVTPALRERDLWNWGLAKETRRILLEEIEMALDARNGGLAHGERYRFRKIFDFRYTDGTRMLTVGGVFFQESDAAKLDECRFEDLDFVRTGDDDYFIDLPRLTPRELRYLDSLLPGCEPHQWGNLPMPEKDAEKYARLYRYYPFYALSDL